MKSLRGEPDLVLFGGRVATVDRGFRVTGAVAIKDGHIMAVGESAEVRALAGRQTEVVDLRGCMALPGFIDSHCHPTQVSLRQLKLDLMDCRSIAEVLERVNARAAQSPPGQWVEGEPAKLADVIILDRDILRCPEDEIKDAEVLVTLLGGTLVHGTFAGLGRG